MKPGFFIMERGIMSASWLGRWTAADPIGVRDGLNLFNYGHCNPVCFTDTQGTENIPVTDVDRKVKQLTPNQLWHHLAGLID